MEEQGRSASKDYGKNELVEKAVDLFFPRQNKTKQKYRKRIPDFMVDGTDFQEHSLDGQISFGELHEQTKLHLLHFYLTNHKDNNIDSQPENSSGKVAKMKSVNILDAHFSSCFRVCTSLTEATTNEDVMVPFNHNWLKCFLSLFHC